MAIQFNQATIAGYLTRDPELKFTKSGVAVCNISVAVNRIGKNDEVDFFDVTIWREQGENVANFLKKGSAVLISGRMEQQTWDDRDTGKKRSKIIVVANQVQFLDKKSDGNGGGSGSRRTSDRELEEANGYSRTTQGQARQAAPSRQPIDLNEEDYDDIPF